MAHLLPRQAAARAAIHRGEVVLEMQSAPRRGRVRTQYPIITRHSKTAAAAGGNTYNSSATAQTVGLDGTAQQEKAQSFQQAVSWNAGAGFDQVGRGRTSRDALLAVRRPGRVPSLLGRAGAAAHVKPAAAGTAGTVAAGMLNRSSGSAAANGMAGKASAGGRFVQSVQQSARDGDANSIQHSSQQQNISVSSLMNGRQRDSGTAGNALVLPAHRRQREMYKAA